MEQKWLLLHCKTATPIWLPLADEPDKTRQLPFYGGTEAESELASSQRNWQQ